MPAPAYNADPSKVTQADFGDDRQAYTTWMNARGIDVGANERAAAAAANSPAAATQPGQPSIPDFLSPNDANGNLKSQYALTAQPDIKFASSLADISNRIDSPQLAELQKEALATPGTSAWEQLAKTQQGLDERGAMNNASEQQSGANAGAFSDLASKGGLSSGSRERLATSGANNLANSLQNVGAQGQQARAAIGTQAEQNRLGQLGASTTAGLQAAGLYGQTAESENQRQQDLGLANRQYDTNVQGQNLQNTLLGVAGQNNYNLGKYGEQMKGYAANQQSAATAASSGGGKK